VFIVIISVIAWVGMIWESEGDDFLKEVCTPIEFLAESQHDLATSFMGYEPEWTLKTYQYLVSNCYYVASKFYSDPTQ
ncbi:MAG: hypothetical protein OXR68_07025, partial [Alphaproteobacteria bacterium]|nr:hypothetical protein [Alphaproteobacteria bacterium]